MRLWLRRAGMENFGSSTWLELLFWKSQANAIVFLISLLMNRMLTPPAQDRLSQDSLDFRQ
jgi:hypothetical protein